MVLRNNWFMLAGVVLALQTVQVLAMEFEGFGSIGYHKHDSKGHHAGSSGEYAEGFTLGGFDLYAFQKIGEDTSAFAEFIIGDFEEEIELERLWIKRTISPALGFKAGLMESPLGYWNRTYRHGGQLLQDTITRPFFLRYEDEGDSIFPMVSVGVEAFGTIPLAGGDLNYVAVFSNGVSLDTSVAGAPSSIQINHLGDPGDEKLFIMRTAYKFSALPLQIGLFGMNNPIVESAKNASVSQGVRLLTQNVLGADLHMAANGFELIAEYYNIDNKDAVGNIDADPARAWFMQFGYQLTARLKPLYRYVSLGFDAADPFFRYRGVQEQQHHVAGLRYDLDESNALKFEVHQMNFDGGETEYHYQLQWAFIVF